MGAQFHFQLGFLMEPIHYLEAFTHLENLTKLEEFNKEQSQPHFSLSRAEIKGSNAHQT